MQLMFKPKLSADNVQVVEVLVDEPVQSDAFRFFVRQCLNALFDAVCNEEHISKQTLMKQIAIVHGLTMHKIYNESPEETSTKVVPIGKAKLKPTKLN